jgi:hypothetical protein
VCHEANARRRRKPPPCPGIQNQKADRLPDGPATESHLKKARDHESSAHANDWRDSNLHAPK